MLPADISTSTITYIHGCISGGCKLIVLALASAPEYINVLYIKFYAHQKTKTETKYMLVSNDSVQ